jgi:undecaprenyl-diphosphatase
VVLVSNNPYTLEPPGLPGSRAALDGGMLGVLVLDPPRAARMWTTPAFEVRAAEPVQAGVDGEAVELEPPLRFAIRPRALRVLVPPATVAEAKRPRGESFLAQPARALWVAGAMLALVLLFGVLLPSGPLAVDRSWAEAMHDLETPVLTHLARVFNWLGEPIGRSITLAVVGLLLALRRRWLALAALAVAVGLAVSLSTLLKTLTERPRPPHGLVHPLGSSFPSGHATYAGAMGVALVLLFTVPGVRRRWWWLLAGAGVAGMAWSRTYLEVHWLSDVVAGALLGSGVALLVFAVAQRLTG